MPDGLHYVPWQGAGYRAGYRDGLRLLIVGDSFHDPVGAPDFPATVVGEFIDGRRNYPFFAAIQRVVTGTGAADLGARRAFWSRVAFTNLVQEPMAAASMAPTAAQWRRAWACFPETVAVTQPDAAFLFSKRGWDAEAGARGTAGGTVLDLAPDGKGRGFARLRVEAGRRFVSGCFYHPRYLSRNKEDLDVWHRWAVRLLGEAPRLLPALRLPGSPKASAATGVPCKPPLTCPGPSARSRDR